MLKPLSQLSPEAMAANRKSGSRMRSDGPVWSRGDTTTTFVVYADGVRIREVASAKVNSLKADLLTGGAAVVKCHPVTGTL